MATLKIQNISKHFNTLKVLHNINIDIEDGEFLVLVGPSGCGKSTLMNIIAGLEEPSTGSLELGEKDITHLAPDVRDTAMVFQSYALYPNMNVAQNIAFPLEMRKVPKSDIEETVGRVTKLLQIDHLRHKKPRHLSGGQRQRVAIGRALAREPQLFLFDEPLSNLDAKLRVDMRAELKKLHIKTGVTTIYVTHDQVEAMTLGHRIAVLKDGIIQQLATPLELYETPANQFVAEFIGSPAINILSATTDEQGVIAIGGVKTALSTSHKNLNCMFGIRPEDIVLSERGSIEGEVVLTEPTGAETYLVVNSPFGEITLRVAKERFMQAQVITMDFPREKLHFFAKGDGSRIV